MVCGKEELKIPLHRGLYKGGMEGSPALNHSHKVVSNMILF